MRKKNVKQLKMNHWEPLEDLSLSIMIAYLNNDLAIASRAMVDQYLAKNPEELDVLEGLTSFRDEEGWIDEQEVDQFLNASKEYMGMIPCLQDDSEKGTDDAQPILKICDELAIKNQCLKQPLEANIIQLLGGDNDNGLPKDINQ